MNASKGSLLGGVGWWLGALAAVFVPGPDPLARRALRLRPRSGGFAVIGPDGSRLHHISLEAPNSGALRAVRRARRRYLDLDDESVLAVRATLPAAARVNLRDAVSLRMSELTPFTEDEVIFDLGRPVALGADAVAVNAFIAPKRMVAERLAELSDLGIDIDGIVASETGEATGAEIPDFAPELRRRRGARVGLAFLAASALLVGGLVWLHSVATARQDAERRMLQSAVASALDNIREAQTLDEEIAALSASFASPRTRRSGRIAPLELLDGIAEALPDDAYLIGLSWRGDEVVLSGFAVNAPALIGLLEGTPILSEVRFSAPVARDARVDRDRFSIAARAAVPGAGR